MVCTVSGPNPLQPPQAYSLTLPVRVRAAPAPIQPWSPAPINLKEVEELIWHFTNDVRRQHGLPAVSLEASLSKVCLAYSLDMLDRHFFSHTNPEGLTAVARLQSFYQGPIFGWGENIWAGSSLNAVSPVALARHILDAWLYSPGHRQNILGPAYTHMGIGIASTAGRSGPLNFRHT